VKWQTQILVTSAARLAKWTSYVGKTAVKFNIPEAEAVDRSQDLIREHGKWAEPVRPTPALV